MSDFNRDDSQVDPSTDQESRRRKKLSSDELIALFLAFTGIGAILFWTLGQRTSPVNLGALGNGGTPFMSGDTNRSSASDGGNNGGSNAAVNGTVAVPDVKAEAKPASASLGAGTIAAPDERRRPPVAQPADSAESTAPPAQNAKPEATKPDSATNPDLSKAPLAQPGTGIAAKTTEPKAPQGTVEQPGKPKTFSDVPDDLAAKTAILALSSRGVIGGFEDGTYKPDQPINRGQFAAMVQKAFDKPQVKDAMTFTDIKSGSPMKPAIEEATRSGFMNGYPEGVFKPDQSIPRLEMLSAIATGLNLKPSGDPVQSLSKKYTDIADIPKWAIPKVSSAVEAGIVLPNTTQLEPKKVATRADAASYIYQALIKEGKIKP